MREDLFHLYTKWHENPKEYDEEMRNMIDKIIYFSMQKFKTLPIYYRTEEKDDLIQDLRLMCFSRLKQKIDNPSNKRIFNYLKICIRGRLLDHTKRVGRYMDRDRVELPVKDHSDIPTDFGSKTANQVASLLSRGEKKSDICKHLNLTKKEYLDSVNQIKNYYEETYV